MAEVSDTNIFSPYFLAIVFMTFKNYIRIYFPYSFCFNIDEMHAFIREKFDSFIICDYL